MVDTRYTIRVAVRGGLRMIFFAKCEEKWKTTISSTYVYMYIWKVIGFNFNITLTEETRFLFYLMFNSGSDT